MDWKDIPCLVEKHWRERAAGREKESRELGKKGDPCGKFGSLVSKDLGAPSPENSHFLL